MVYCIEKPNFEDNSRKTRILQSPSIFGIKNNFKKCSLSWHMVSFFDRPVWIGEGIYLPQVCSVLGGDSHLATLLGHRLGDLVTPQNNVCMIHQLNGKNDKLEHIHRRFHDASVVNIPCQNGILRFFFWSHFDIKSCRRWVCCVGTLVFGNGQCILALTKLVEGGWYIVKTCPCIVQLANRDPCT